MVTGGLSVSSGSGGEEIQRHIGSLVYGGDGAKVVLLGRMWWLWFSVTGGWMAGR